MAFKSLDALVDADAGRVGGKAWNCARLKQQGFPIPDGIVVPAGADDADIDAIDRDPWFDTWPPDEQYAVRSSGLGEDAPEQSFAGIHDTRLNVPRGGVRDAVAACRASAASERAVAYRRARGLPETAAALGVLIQRMIHAVTAGVAFTIDPITGSADEIVVNAAPGLGVAVVDGTIEPAESRIRKSAAAADQLGALLVEIERFFGTPQDVEWCFDGTRYWIVQSRPITVRPTEGQRVSDVEWTRANLAEVLPEITSPQVLAAVEVLLNVAERRHLGGLLAPYDVLGPMVKPFYGRLYFNISQMRHVSFVTGTPPAEVLRSIGHPGDITPEDDIAPRPPILTLLALLPVFVRLGVRYFRTARIVRAHQAGMAARVSALRSIDPATRPDEALVATILEWDRDSPEALGVVLLLGGVLFHERMLRKICGRAGFSFERLLHAHLATGERSVSAQQAVDLVALADTARREPRVREWLMLRNDSLHDMRADLHETAFMHAFERFLEQYGHRGLYETDWSMPRYTEEPAPLLAAIRAHLRDDGGGDRAAADARAAAGAAAAWSEFERCCTGCKATAESAESAEKSFSLRVLRALRLLPRWVAVRRARSLLTTIKHYYVWREKARSDLIRVSAVLREWHLVLARRFVERGWLDQVNDYFLLHVDEIVVAGPQVRAIARRRAAELERYRRLDMPLLMRESQLPRLLREAGRGEVDSGDGDLRGDPVSRGAVEGEVVVILDPGDFSQMKRGAILVTRATDPSWTPLFTLAAGVIVEVGGILSHASTIAREYGIPALANVRHATKRLRTGDRVELNATEGFIRIAARR